MTNTEAKAEIARLATVPVAPDYFVATDGAGLCAAPFSGWVRDGDPKGHCSTEAEASRRAVRQDCKVVRRSPAAGRAKRIARLEAVAK